MRRTTVIAALALTGATLLLAGVYVDVRGDARERSPRAMYEHAVAQEQAGHLQEAGHWFQKAAFHGHPLAQVEVAFMYRYGRTGLLRDPYEREQWYRRAVQGKPAFTLAELSYTTPGISDDYGISGVLLDDREADRWMRRAAATCREAAVAGDLDAQVMLAGLYASGTGVARDLAMAERLWRDAAGRGSAQAQMALARMYWYRHAYAEARPWLDRAAAQGQASAEYYLSMMYQYGYGVAPDHAHALTWLRRAADHGSLFARKQLAGMEAQQLLASGTAVPGTGLSG